MKTLLKSVRSISEEIDKAATLTTTEKHLLNLVRSEDKELEDNVGSNILSCKRENKANDNVPLTTEETLLKSVGFRQDENKEKTQSH